MKKPSKTSPRILLSGGGTGGHIYPAIAIADEIRSRLPHAQFLFAGALGKMEMEKVPKAGYQIKGFPIQGVDRGNLLKNFGLPFKLYKSLKMAKAMVKDFKPDLAIGTGGYASGPLLWEASKKGIPCLLQEQNSFAGLTNKRLGKRAKAICVAYEGMDKFFPEEKIHITGNPIRKALLENKPEKKEAVSSFGLDPEKPTVLSIGGSLGSRSINNSWLEKLEEFLNEDVQLIWQTGSLDFKSIQSKPITKNLKVVIREFIYEMDIAYAAADLVVSRAGAIAISELSALGKASVLLPLPSAAEDHQTKNAEYLVKRLAGKLITDQRAKENLVPEVLSLLSKRKEIKAMEENNLSLGKPMATEKIVEIALNLI